MGRRLRELVLTLMRVPPEPEAPSGSKGSVKIFRASKKYFQLKLLGWTVGQISTLVGIVAALFFINVEFAGIGLSTVIERAPREDLVRQLILAAEVFGVVTFVLLMPFSYFVLRFDFEYRWYIVTDRSLRIREGVWKVSEMTLTFANVQEVSIRQGPLQRLLGISDLKVRTAGGGATTGPPAKQRHDQEHDGHVGYFRGVDNAEEIRDLILLRLKTLRDAGLGDPDQARAAADVGGEGAAPGGDVLAAARELLDAARSLNSVGGQPAR